MTDEEKYEMAAVCTHPGRLYCSTLSADIKEDTFTDGTPIKPGQWVTVQYHGEDVVSKVPCPNALPTTVENGRVIMDTDVTITGRHQDGFHRAKSDEIGDDIYIPLDTNLNGFTYGEGYKLQITPIDPSERNWCRQKTGQIVRWKIAIDNASTATVKKEKYMGKKMNWKPTNSTASPKNWGADDALKRVGIVSGFVSDNPNKFFVWTPEEVPGFDGIGHMNNGPKLELGTWIHMRIDKEKGTRILRDKEKGRFEILSYTLNPPLFETKVNNGQIELRINNFIIDSTTRKILGSGASALNHEDMGMIADDRGHTSHLGDGSVVDLIVRRLKPVPPFETNWWVRDVQICNGRKYEKKPRQQNINPKERITREIRNEPSSSSSSGRNKVTPSVKVTIAGEESSDEEWNEDESLVKGLSDIKLECLASNEHVAFVEAVSSAKYLWIIDSPSQSILRVQKGGPNVGEFIIGKFTSQGDGRLECRKDEWRTCKGPDDCRVINRKNHVVVRTMIQYRKGRTFHWSKYLGEVADPNGCIPRGAQDHELFEVIVLKMKDIDGKFNWGIERLANDTNRKNTRRMKNTRMNKKSSPPMRRKEECDRRPSPPIHSKTIKDVKSRFILDDEDENEMEGSGDNRRRERHDMRTEDKLVDVVHEFGLLKDPIVRQALIGAIGDEKAKIVSDYFNNY